MVFLFILFSQQKHFPDLTLTWTLTSPSQIALTDGTWLKQTKLCTAIPSFICTKRSVFPGLLLREQNPMSASVSLWKLKTAGLEKNHFQVSHGAELKSSPCCTIFIFVTA